MFFISIKAVAAKVDVHVQWRTHDPAPERDLDVLFATPIPSQFPVKVSSANPYITRKKETAYKSEPRAPPKTKTTAPIDRDFEEILQYLQGVQAGLDKLFTQCGGTDANKVATGNLLPEGVSFGSIEAIYTLRFKNVCTFKPEHANPSTEAIDAKNAAAEKAAAQNKERFRVLTALLCQNTTWKLRLHFYLGAAIERHPIGGAGWLDFALRFNNFIRTRPKMDELQTLADEFIISVMKPADRQQHQEIAHWTPNIEQDVGLFWEKSAAETTATAATADTAATHGLRGTQSFLTGSRVPFS